MIPGVSGVVVTLVKGLHIGGILLWGAGLLALPLMLAKHDPSHGQREYQRIRRFTHYGYTRLLTPAAVIAVGAGTALLFLRSAFVPWMFGKLVLVGGLVVLHAWIGNLVVRMGEHNNERQPSPVAPLVTIAMVLLVGILALVLSKPPISEEIVPSLLRSPQDRQLPVDEVPT